MFRKVVVKLDNEHKSGIMLDTRPSDSPFIDVLVDGTKRTFPRSHVSDPIHESFRDEHAHLVDRCSQHARYEELVSHFMRIESPFLGRRHTKREAEMHAEALIYDLADEWNKYVRHIENEREEELALSLAEQRNSKWGVLAEEME